MILDHLKPQPSNAQYSPWDPDQLTDLSKASLVLLQSFQPSAQMLENNGYTQKYPTYPKYPEIPERKKDTWTYPIVYLDTPTRPEPDPLPGILSNTRPDPILKNPTRWALLVLLSL